jgi:hypothetical protein
MSSIPSLFSAFEACKIVAAKMVEGSALIYSVIADPQGSGRSMIVVKDSAGSFVGCL